MKLNYILRDTPQKNEHLCVYEKEDGTLQNILLCDLDAKELTYQQLDSLAIKSLENPNETDHISQSRI